MNILLVIPGKLRTVPMGVFSAQALEALGHRVAVFDDSLQPLDKLARALSQGLGLRLEERPFVNRRLRALLREFRPDLFLSVFGFGVSPRSLAAVRAARVPSACWWINDPFQFERSAARAPGYDWVFSNSAVCAQWYRERGVAASGFLPTACEPSVHRPVAAVPDYACELCFAGDWSPLREQVVARLAQRFEVRVFGPWGRKLAPDSPLRRVLRDGFFSPDEMAAMFASAAVVLNLHAWQGRFDHGVNPRLFEAAACGAFQVVDDKREIASLFTPGAELAVVPGPDDLAGAVADALADPQGRARAGQAALQRALAQHTYRHRMASLISAMGAA
jgi:spore maturation protein CgeB